MGLQLGIKKVDHRGNTDIPLDEEGVRMAAQIAERLENEHWDVIYTSPLIRAKKTTGNS